MRRHVRRRSRGAASEVVGTDADVAWSVGAVWCSMALMADVLLRWGVVSSHGRAESTPSSSEQALHLIWVLAGACWYG